MAPFRIRHDKFLSCLRRLQFEAVLGHLRPQSLDPLAGAEHSQSRFPQFRGRSGLDPAAEPSQRFPAGVLRTLFAGARRAVAILTAARAKSFAIRLAQGSDRQGQKHLLPQHIFKQQTVSLIIPDFRFRRSNGPFGRLGIGLGRPEDQVELGAERNFDRLDAARAGT
jgi:hypothetical protein